MITRSTPIFATADILASIAYYKDILGFETSWTWGEPPTFGSVSWGNVEIMFNLQPELAAKVLGHQNWIRVDDVDELYALHQERGAKIVSSIEDKPWGVREFVVEDPSGYHLRFAGSPSHVVKKSSPLPIDIRIEPRMPTAEEFQRVAGEVFYRDGVPPGVLEKSWNGVVASSPDGEAIGTVRIMHDAPGWFSLWDVAVLPEWQGQRIGEAMMKEALDLVRQAFPGAFVFLFTYKQGFYERLGFGTETVSMRKV